MRGPLGSRLREGGKLDDIFPGSGGFDGASCVCPDRVALQRSAVAGRSMDMVHLGLDSWADPRICARALAVA